MTGPAEKPDAGERHSGGLAQLVRWLNEERPVTGDDAGFVAGAPRRVARFTYGEPVATTPKIEVERDVLAEVRIGPAPRCAVAGETIALSVSLINSRGDIYLGWPIKLEWSSSDPSVATVSDGGIVEVHAKGRVELTCRCEGKSGSILLTVVEPEVAAAVGLPVPARLLAKTQPAARPFPHPFPQPSARPGEQPTADRQPKQPTNEGVAPPSAQRDPLPAQLRSPEPLLAEPLPPEPLSHESLSEVPPDGVRAELVAQLAPQLSPVHRRSIERRTALHSIVESLAPSRGTRRFLFRAAVGAATGAFVVVALSQSPEEYFVVDPEPTAAMAAQMSTRPAGTSRRPVASNAALRPRVVLPTPAVTAAVPTRDASPAPAPTSEPARADAGAATPVTTAVATPAPAGPSQPTPQPTPAQPLASTVSRVVLASSPSQLVEGESLQLSAAGVDDRGSPIEGRAVTWKSENGDVAVVDDKGVVTARRPGTVTIVASSEGRTGRVTLTVGARRPEPAPTRESPAPVAAPAREARPAAAVQVMRARIDEFVQALRERNSGRVAELYNADSPHDRKNLQALLERLRRNEARLKASDAQLGTPEVREMEAAVEFQVPMSWTTPFGRVRNQTATFRAVLESDDDGWRVVAIRAVGKID